MTTVWTTPPAQSLLQLFKSYLHILNLAHAVKTIFHHLINLLRIDSVSDTRNRVHSDLSYQQKPNQLVQYLKFLCFIFVSWREQPARLPSPSTRLKYFLKLNHQVIHNKQLNTTTKFTFVTGNPTQCFNNFPPEKLVFVQRVR